MADNYSDDLLIAEFQAGLPQAFREVFDRYYEKLFFTAFKLIRNREEAQDLAVTALQKLFERHADFDNISHVASFLFISVRNRSLNYLRDLKVRNNHQAAWKDALANKDAAFEDQLDAEYFSVAINAMGKLPEKARLVLQLKYIEGLKYQEIADHLGISVNTVKNHITKSLLKLRQTLKVDKLSDTAVIALCLMVLH